MRLVFSRNRAAQLDLLLRSLDQFMPEEQTNVIWKATTALFYDAYMAVPLFLQGQQEKDFENDLIDCLVNCDEEYVTFFCDDDVLFRTPDTDPAQMLADDSQILCHSLRLGRGNTRMLLPEGFPIWRWKQLPRTDFGYPAAIDGHTFRVKDVLRLIGNSRVENPTMLETVMAMRVDILSNQRPLMASCEEQCLVGVPVNRVSPSSGVAHGEHFPCTAEEANERFLAGQRISLDSIDPSLIDSCHREFEFIWEKRP